jgi:hypothetical protein
MRRQFIQLGDGVICEAREHVAESGEWIDLNRLTRSHEAAQYRRCSAATSLPKKIRLARPTAKQRSARWVCRSTDPHYPRSAKAPYSSLTCRRLPGPPPLG